MEKRGPSETGGASVEVIDQELSPPPVQMTPFATPQQALAFAYRMTWRRYRKHEGRRVPFAIATAVIVAVISSLATTDVGQALRDLALAGVFAYDQSGPPYVAADAAYLASSRVPVRAVVNGRLRIALWLGLPLLAGAMLGMSLNAHSPLLLLAAVWQAALSVVLGACAAPLLSRHRTLRRRIPAVAVVCLGLLRFQTDIGSAIRRIGWQTSAWVWLAGFSAAVGLAALGLLWTAERHGLLRSQPERPLRRLRTPGLGRLSGRTLGFAKAAFEEHVGLGLSAFVVLMAGLTLGLSTSSWRRGLPGVLRQGVGGFDQQGTVWVLMSLASSAAITWLVTVTFSRRLLPVPEDPNYLMEIEYLRRIPLSPSDKFRAFVLVPLAPVAAILMLGVALWGMVGGETGLLGAASGGIEWTLAVPLTTAVGLWAAQARSRMGVAVLVSRLVLLVFELVGVAVAIEGAVVGGPWGLLLAAVLAGAAMGVCGMKLGTYVVRRFE